MEQKDYLAAIRSALVGIGVGMAVLVVGALIATRLAHPEGFLTVTAYAALLVGAVICGVLQGRGGAPIHALLLSAGLYGLLPMIVSVVIGGFDRFVIRGAVYLLMALIATLVGWLVPASRPRRKYRYK